MRIGIDVSQIAFENTGVSNYISNLVRNLVKVDNKNDYILFFSSMRRKFSRGAGSRFARQISDYQNVKIKKFKFPPLLLDLLWNRFHIVPIEWLIGDVDVFITSDWTEPPAKKAKKVTILYDLIIYKYPDETHKKIVKVQARKLKWVKTESDVIICISEATKRDAIQILGLDEKKLKVVYPGI